MVIEEVFAAGAVTNGPPSVEFVYMLHALPKARGKARKAQDDQLCSTNKQEELVVFQKKNFLAVAKDCDGKVGAWKGHIQNAEKTLDQVLISTNTCTKKFLAERNGAFDYFHDVVSALKWNIKAREEKNDRAVDMFFKMKKLYEQSLATVEPSNAAAVSALKWKVSNLSGEVEAKDFKLQTISGLVEEANKLRGQLV